jgi:hypothetical protein
MSLRPDFRLQRNEGAHRPTASSGEPMASKGVPMNNSAALISAAESEHRREIHDDAQRVCPLRVCPFSVCPLPNVCPLLSVWPLLSVCPRM